MKVVQIAKPATIATLRTVDVGEPRRPGQGEMLVRVVASSLNFHDLRIVTGGLPAAEGIVPLGDAAGEVIEVGEGVREFSVGDTVISVFMPEWVDGRSPDPMTTIMPGDRVDGFAAEYVTMPTGYFTRAPRNLSLPEAATLPTAGVTAWRAVVDESEVKPGGTLLVLGTGGVSIFALQIAKAMGMKVIATSSSDAKLERLTRMGADHVINYRTFPDWSKEVLRLTDGIGVDAIIEVGGASTILESIQAVRVQGVIVVIGALSGREAPLPISTIFSKQMKIKGVVVASRRQQTEFVAGIEATGIKPVISHSFALADIADAFRFQESGSHFGKISVTM
ncbi:NAD(P)-dependent alcohol dehydrogenase [Novosphingobium sp. 9U]|uniref:zinc-dependent alcohol dehydrogenase family protein n=1 Tax=Novosphingobium sp. 9U TaxID=2653158 RepID=UPI0012F1AD4D|nr:NAD(P)-dependent alcohol dehydrogenase [Novosphingobium sp. 9U]VWX50603.1 Alcohol dehydrogenase [Novosphingobium sp. 9U]